MDVNEYPASDEESERIDAERFLEVPAIPAPLRPRKPECEPEDDNDVEEEWERVPESPYPCHRFVWRRIR